MARLETFPSEKSAYVDESTGREVIQFTAGTSTNRNAYAALCPFSAHDRYIIFASNRTGNWQIFRGEIDGGETRQLTDRDGVQSDSFNVAPPGREVFYQAGVRVWAVDIETGDDRPVKIVITLANSAGIFQVDELLRHKLTNSTIEEHVEILAKIEGETERRLIEMYRL